MKKLFIFLVIGLLTQSMTAQEYIPTKENLETREWFQDAKFGLFVHWGVYSVLGVHEWVMETQKINIPTYEKIPPFFNPTEFNAEEWVLMAKNAGMKYITITAKHHDGFAMFNSQYSDWDIIDRTVYKKDILKQLAEACRKYDLKLFFYYSQLDWHHEGYFPRGETGKSAGRKDSGDWDSYLTYMNNQLSELLTNYGDVAGIWFDGWWDKKEADWKLEETYNLIHKLQPAAMIGSNHHKAPMAGEDFQMFEKDLPGQNKGGFSADAKIGALPLETAETMAHRWGFSLQDNAYKSEKELIQYIVKAAGNNSNFLLNVGPMPNGKIQPEFVKTLKSIGEWMKTNGETIYETRGGSIPPSATMVSTQKGKTLYLHVLESEKDLIFVEGFNQKVKSIKLFKNGKKIKHTINEFGLFLELSKEDKNEMDTIIEITLK